MEWDLLDGVIDKQNANTDSSWWKIWKKSRHPAPSVGFQQGKGKSKQELENDRLRRELEELKEQVKRIREEGENDGQNDRTEKGNESRGKSASSGGENTYVFQREIDPANAHPQFTQRVQPDKYRGIDEKMYVRFVKVASDVLAEDGRYNKSKIVRRAGISKPTVSKYFHVAFQRQDLQE